MIKNTFLAIAACNLVGGFAYAQTNVTLYGIADVSVRYESNTDTSTNSRVHMTDSATTQSRWGIKGTEDLGGGLKAVFQLEQGFSVDSGAQSDPNRFFNRQALVGLQGNFGRVTVGRQYSLFFDFGLDFDPLGIANYNENSFYVGQQYTLRADNMVKYATKVGGLKLGTSYALGEQAGDNKKGRQLAGMASYAMGAFAFGGAYQTETSLTNLTRSSWTVGATYTADIYTIRATYLNNDDKRMQGAHRQDNTYGIGTTVKVTPALALTGAAYYDRMKLSGQDGKRYVLVGLAEYSLSKKVLVYGAVDYTKVDGAALADLNTSTKVGLNDKRINVGVGMRYV
ncbi:MAG: porin, partial [Glaciimonas sp.]|nr:porin [Glaciimonas sp.]